MAKRFQIFRAVCSLFPVALVAEEPDKRPAKGIQDNSFLVEEAYNQELGVVQHIFNLRYDMNKRRGPNDREWHLIFTQEWPVFSQAHHSPTNSPIHG